MQESNASVYPVQRRPESLYWVGDNIGSGVEVTVEAITDQGARRYLNLAETMAWLPLFDRDGRRRLEAGLGARHVQRPRLAA